jgi:hypothetical protein
MPGPALAQHVAEFEFAIDEFENTGIVGRVHRETAKIAAPERTSRG